MDVASGVVHTLIGTAANEADIDQMAAVLHGEEEAVFADAGYTGADKRPELADREVSWNIAVKRSIIKALPKALRDLAEPMERALAQVRARVEHPFHVVKNLFRHSKKLRYRGLAKNTAQLHITSTRVHPPFSDQDARLAVIVNLEDWDWKPPAGPLIAVSPLSGPRRPEVATSSTFPSATLITSVATAAGSMGPSPAG